MSPSKVADCVHNIWENEKLLLCGNLTMMFSGKCTSTCFDIWKWTSWLVCDREKLFPLTERLLCFAVPSISTRRKKNYLKTSTKFALNNLTGILPESFDGKLELELLWDPLAASRAAMETYRVNLQRLLILPHTSNEQGMLDQYGREYYNFAETFKKVALFGKDRSWIPFIEKLIEILLIVQQAFEYSTAQ